MDVVAFGRALSELTVDDIRSIAQDLAAMPARAAIVYPGHYRNALLDGPA